jgi:hypothetical protein
MNAPAPLEQFDVEWHVDPLLCFVARAEARALLWQAAEIDLHEAVDELQAAAERDGVVAQIGQDAAQQIMAHAFGAVRA